MAALRAANLATKFALELAAVAAFAYWGATISSGAAAAMLAVVLPLVPACLWAGYAAPRAPRRLPLRLRIPFELTVFTLAGLALLAASTAAAVVFASVVMVNSLLLTALDQWEM